MLALAAAIVVAFDSNTRLLADYADGARTESINLSDAVKVWRQDAWRQDDFLAQVRLGDIYSMNQSFGSNESKNEKYLDRVEAYVWYYMALRPGHDYRADETNSTYDALYNIRGNALDNAKEIYYQLTFEQRLEARARILYILSSRGAEGFLTLGRIHASGIYVESTRSDKPYAVLCVNSSWNRWYSSWLWWLWSSVTGKPYPHVPVWKWVANTQENWDTRLPDWQCDGQEQPPEPTDNFALPGSASNSSAGTTGAMALNSGSRGVSGPGLPFTSPTTSIGPDPRVGGSSGAVATVNPGGGSSGGAGGPYPPGTYPAGTSMSGSVSASSGNSAFYSPVPSVFTSNDAEALTYFIIAQQMGHPLASVYANVQRNALRFYNPDAARLIADAEQRARYWYPPYEFYPGGTVGGIAHSDDRQPTLEERIALGRVMEMPPFAVAEALCFRGYLKVRFCNAPPPAFRLAVVQFQKAFGFEPTGFITPQQQVLIIKMAADAGDAIAQDRLGIMYAKGIGVAKNFVRAEYWFIKAANQGFPDAFYNLYVLYKVGPNGVEPDEHKAVSYATRAIAAAYNPAKCELLYLLDQPDGPGHDHPGGARR